MPNLTKDEVKVLFKVIDHFEGSDHSTMLEDQHCRHIETKLEVGFKKFSDSCNEIEALTKQLEAERAKVRKAYEALESENLEDIPYNVACALGYS